MKTPRPPHLERGFTLVEAMVVVVIAGVIGVGLVGFYINSQGTWLDASTQAIAQRDATLIVETFTQQGRGWASAGLSLDSTTVFFYDTGLIERDRFFWSPADSLVHHVEERTVDRGTLSNTLVERFAVRLQGSRTVRLDTLLVRSATGQRVLLSSSFSLYNGS